MLWGGVSVEPESWMSGRCVGNPPEPVCVEEHETMKSMTSTARDAVAALAARFQKRKIMARMLARHSRCATVRLHPLVVRA
jgi:hypothetical protein